MPPITADTIEDDAELEPVEQPEAPVDEPSDVEARARAMGWHPFDEYRGPADKWTDAATFIKRGEDHLPILRDQVRRMTERQIKRDREIDDLKKTAGEQLEAIRGLRDLAQRSNEAGYKRALAELKQQQRAAVEAGDTEAFDQIGERIDAVQAERAELAAPASPPPPPAAPAQPQLPPEIQAFADDNAAWWNVDPMLTNAMIAMHTLVLQRNPSMPLRQQLAEAKRRLVEEFPDRFDEDEMSAPTPTPRPRAAAVAAPRSGTQPRQVKTGFDTIDDPAEREQARQAFASIKRQMPDYTVEEYLAVYNNPRADVIEMRRAKRTAK